MGCPYNLETGEFRSSGIIFVLEGSCISTLFGLPWILPRGGGASGEEPASQCRRRKRLRFDPWVGKIPWGMATSTPVFLPGESHGLPDGL